MSVSVDTPCVVGQALTLPTSAPDARLVSGDGMTSLTRRAAPGSPGQVLLDRDRFQVVGVDACPVAAQVVDGQPFRDRPLVILVGPPMSDAAPALVRYGEGPVSTWADRSDPLPAPLGRKDDPLPESLDEGSPTAVQDRQRVTVSRPPSVVGYAPLLPVTAGIHRLVASINHAGHRATLPYAGGLF